MLLEVRDLKKYYPIKRGIFPRSHQFVRAVDGVSFSVREGETLGLVGESGCGKSTVGKVILKLENMTDGNIYFGGAEIGKIKGSELMNFRKRMQIVFQDPYNSLNPRMRVREIVAGPLVAQGIAKGRGLYDRVSSVLDKVGLGPGFLKKYPHQLSGGQCQRVGIARALVSNPKMVVLDEPVSALDVSIQAQILNLMLQLKESLHLSYLFISHDLSVIEYVSDHVAVMYMGKIVEFGSTEALFTNQFHPYTRALMLAVPSLEPVKKRRREILLGEPPNPSDPPSGCRFHKRCSKANSICKETPPSLEPVGGDHWVACHDRTSTSD